MRLPYIASLLAICPLLGVPVGAASDTEPKITSTKFQRPPHNLFFFEDSETALALITDIEASVGEVYKTDNAGTNWTKVEDFPEREPYVIYPHPTDRNVSVTLGRAKKHWITYDRGETWKKFETEVHPSRFDLPIRFHASDSKKLLFQGMEECDIVTMACWGKTWYTTDGFESLKLLADSRKDCLWAKTTERFETGDKKSDENRILCLVPGKYSEDPEDSRLLYTDDFFETGTEPKMGSRAVPGMSNLAAVKGYIVAAAKASKSRELALYVTDDTNTWHRAEFGGNRIEEDAYTILESTNYSIQVDVKTSDRAYLGELFSSNSNGTYFSPNIKHTNRNEFGNVDFEKIQDIQGILLVNVVDNWEEVEKTWLVGKEVKSQISINDGRDWSDLKAGDESLHVHSVTEQRQNGKVFSSAAPGLVLGVGNTGSLLGQYSKGDLYASYDAGETWRKARDGPYLYEFGGAGSIIIATRDLVDTDLLAYSFDFGQTWKNVTLPHSLRIFEVTTITDSTSLKFLLSGIKHTKGDDEFYAVSVDFAGTLDKCGEDDFEEWYPRLNKEKEAVCIMGHKQKFKRRKPNAACLVDDEFNEPIPKSEQCPCDDKFDFECDYEFKKSEGKCVPVGAVPVPAGACKDGDKEFEGSSGYRLIPGNNCKRKEGKQLDDPVMQSCNGTGSAPPKGGDTDSKIHTFKHPIEQYQYLPHSSLSDDSANPEEPVVVLTNDGQVYISYNHGMSWDPIPGVEDNVIGLVQHPYNHDYIYLVTSSKKVHYSKNNGKSFHSFDAPEAPALDRQIQIMMFHADNHDWLIWIGGKDCKGGANPDCHTVAHVSTKGGEDWTAMLSFVEKCQFVPRSDREKLVLCEKHANDDVDAPLQLLSSDDWFEHETRHFEDIVNFATMSEFIVVAAKTEDKKYLKVDTSIDGQIFAQAEFPPNFQVPHQQAYTVLESNTHAIFMHVTVNAAQGQEYGTIIKSNSNGTEYVLSLSNVNRNRGGYVDFEKIASLEGVAIANVVSNIEDVEGGAKKKVQTLVTHNDGAEWSLITPPEHDADGKSYKCAGDELEKCALHLHGYSERDDPRSTFGSPSAIGLVMGIGNVGPYLSNDVTDTFISEDGGITWKIAMEGRYMWDYGDQGGIIAIVKKGSSTGHMFYSLDRGDNWQKYTFSEKEVVIKAITSVPQDNSRRFLLWGDDFTVSIDFSHLNNKECVLDEEKPEADDYEFFIPGHPMQDGPEKDCLFGHRARYHRKKKTSQCYNGPNTERLHGEMENCACTRHDFECAYNYERQTDGSCSLVHDLSPIDPMQVCYDDPKRVEYFNITGYRRIPLTTCAGGLEMDETSTPHPCPGHESDFNKKRGPSKVALFFAIVLPIAAAAGIGYFVWHKYGDKLGSIRLGDGPSLYSPGRSGGNDWVQYPIAAVSAVVAVVAALPMLLGAAWRGVRSMFPGGYGGRTYTSRSSFARGRGDYAAVDADEGELLGEDSDEEV